MIRIYSIWCKSGKTAFDKKLKLLYANHEYRRYFDELQDVHRTIRTAVDAENFINTVLSLAIVSMNIDVSIFQINAFQSKKELDKFFQNPDNSLKFNPWSRFRILANYCLRKMDTEDISQKVVIVIAASVKGNSTLQCRQVVKSIYADSKALDRIEKRIEQISMDKSRIIYYENVELQNFGTYPTDLNATVWKREYDILDFAPFCTLLKNDSDKYLVFTHPVSGLEDLPILQCIDSSSKLTLCCFYSYFSIPWLLSEFSNRIVLIKRKIYKLLKDFLIDRRQRSYLLMDSAMVDNIRFIHEEFKNGRYTYFYKDNYIVLLIFNSHFTLIQPIIMEARKDLPHILDKYEIHYVEYSVSGYYGDPATSELARIGYEMVSDGRIAQNLLESNKTLEVIEHIFPGKSGQLSVDVRDRILQHLNASE